MGAPQVVGGAALGEVLLAKVDRGDALNNSGVVQAFVDHFRLDPKALHTACHRSSEIVQAPIVEADQLL